MKTQFRQLPLPILKLFLCLLSFLCVSIFTITPFLVFFSANFFSNSSQKKHTFNCLYNANLFKTSCSTPFRLSLCLKPISVLLSPDLHCPLLSKTRLKYYFNTAHCYQDLHCSLMYRCPTAVLDSALSLKITRDTAKIGVPL